ncbi:hypothetical protein EGI24_13310 [Lacihabitans sp. CS3-21]|nr:hypothetical protein [Lacihabitans sp. CS3-21]
MKTIARFMKYSPANSTLLKFSFTLLFSISVIFCVGQNQYENLIKQNFKVLSSDSNNVKLENFDFEKIIDFPTNHIKVLSIGEAVHGSDEIWQLQSNLAIYLATKEDFKTIVLAEFGFINALKLNSYIHSKIDSIDKKLMIPKTFFDRLRVLNQSAHKDNQISIFGTDRDEYKDIIEYLNSIGGNMQDSIWKYTIIQLEKCLLEKKTNYAISNALVLTNQLRLMAFNEGKSLNVSRYDAKILLQVLGNLKLNLEWEFSEKEAMLNRDNIIFENINWIYQELGLSKIGIIYSHNFHGNKITLFEGHKNNGIKAYGELLKNTFGEQYYSIGTEVHSGKYRYGDIKEVVTPSNKLGTTIANQFPLCQIGIFSDSNETCDNYDLESLTITYGTSVSSAEFIGSNICKAFNKIIYLKTIAPVQVYSSKIATFHLLLSSKKEREILSKSKLTISASATYIKESKKGSNFISIYFHDKNSNQLSASKLNDLTKNNEIIIPKNAEKISIGWNLVDIHALQLNSMTLNNKQVDLDTLSFYDWNENYNLKKEQNRYIVELKSD